VWTQCRDVLMRGWWLAEDGRLYHDTIVTRVFAMLEKRAKDAQRAANRRGRAADTAGVTPESRVTHTGVPPEFDTKHQAPSTTTPSLRSGEEGPAQFSRKRAPLIARPEDVTEQTWADWLQLRKSKRAPVTETVLAGARDEAMKAGLSLERFLRIWCTRGSQGLQADWLRPEERRVQSPSAQSFAERDREAGMQRWEEMTGRVHPDRQQQPGAVVIDLPPTPLAIGARS